MEKSPVQKKQHRAKETAKLHSRNEKGTLKSRQQEPYEKEKAGTVVSCVRLSEGEIDLVLVTKLYW